MSKLSFPKDRIKVLLLENIHDNAVALFRAQGYANVERLTKALDPADLLARLPEVHILGIRSRTKLTDEVLAKAERLMAVGCFSIGTDQVDLDAARRRGIPVFNAPYSNTRSVAELVLAEMILLMRGIPEKSWAAHEGVWMKSAEGSNEVRGKTLGIIGYGHIGTQLSVLAEALGMHVIFHDVVEKLTIGNARPAGGLHELLAQADIVSLHVPGTPLTRNMMGPEEFARMKEGAVFINASRGDVVVIEALAEAVRSGRLRGAAIDVFPKEPTGKDEEFVSPLRGLRNVILSPHVGGSTAEAQANIGAEVAEKLIKYSDNGSTVGAVNFVEVSLPPQQGVTRFLHIHRNVPGVIAAINEVFSTRGMNIDSQYLRTDGEIGYVVVEVDGEVEAGHGIRKDLDAIPGTIRVRWLQ